MSGLPLMCCVWCAVVCEDVCVSSGLCQVLRAPPPPPTTTSFTLLRLHYYVAPPPPSSSTPRLIRGLCFTRTVGISIFALCSLILMHLQAWRSRPEPPPASAVPQPHHHHHHHHHPLAAVGAFSPLGLAAQIKGCGRPTEEAGARPPRWLWGVIVSCQPPG